MDDVKYGDSNFPVWAAERAGERLQGVLNSLKYKTGDTYTSIQNVILIICANLPITSEVRTDLVNNYYAHLERKHGIACFRDLLKVKYDPAAHVKDKELPWDN